MPLPKRAVIAVTSATAPLHDGNPTGMFISEVLHPYNVFKAHGFEVDIVSEKGTYVVDWLSQTEDFLNGEDKKQWENTSGEFRQKVDHMPDVKTVDGKNVCCVLAACQSCEGVDVDPSATVVWHLLCQRWSCGSYRLSSCQRTAEDCYGRLETGWHGCCCVSGFLHFLLLHSASHCSKMCL